jgi:hypothetical protein
VKSIRKERSGAWEMKGMRGMMLRRMAFRPMGLLAVLGFLLGFWSCDTNESKGDLLLDVDGDTTWLSADLVIVILRDPDGKFTDTVFNRKATNLNDFSRLPAMHYTGGKVDIDIRIIKEGKVVSQQVRHFDETALYKPTDTIPQILTIGPKVPQTVHRRRKPPVETRSGLEGRAAHLEQRSQ